MSKKLKTILSVSVITLVILVLGIGVFLILNIGAEFVSEEKRGNLVKQFRKDIKNVIVSEKITKIKDTELIIPKGSISVGARYESQLDIDEVEKEFINSLTSNGWTYYHKSSDGKYTELKFCKDKYTADFTNYPSGNLSKPETQTYNLSFNLIGKPLFEDVNPALPEECKR